MRVVERSLLRGLGARLLAGVLACCIALAGCWTPVGSPPAQRDGVLVHGWRALALPPQGAWDGARTALYTYVLVNDVGSADTVSGNPEVINARRALDALLTEVQTGQAADSPMLREVLARANQFCIPARGYGSGALTLKQYDFELATAYVNQARVALAGLPDMADRLGGRGPFLLATRKPFGEVVTRGADGNVAVLDTSTPLLLMDLSGKHPKAMPVYVAAFKDAVRDDATHRSGVIEPLRPAIASAVLRLNEALPFVAEAYAGTRKMFEPAGSGNNR